MKSFRATVLHGYPDHVVWKQKGCKAVRFRACDQTPVETAKTKLFRLNRVEEIVCTNCLFILKGNVAFRQGELYE